MFNEILTATGAPAQARGVASAAGLHERPPRGQYFNELPHWGERPPDPQRLSVYRWQRDVVGKFQREHLIPDFVDSASGRRAARAPADAYLARVWRTHANLFRPFFTGVPALRIGWRTAMRPRSFGRSHAHAALGSHTIYVQLGACTRATILHEIAHLLAWRDHHGPHFCRALLYLWEKEFGVDRAHARAEAARLGVQVAPVDAP
jgi:hypothetical protein